MENTSQNENNKEELQSLSGSVIPNTRAVAFCKLKNIYLNARQLNTRMCLGKRCMHLETLRHPYWHQSSVLRKKKKLEEEQEKLKKEGNKNVKNKDEKQRREDRKSNS